MMAKKAKTAKKVINPAADSSPDSQAKALDAAVKQRRALKELSEENRIMEVRIEEHPPQRVAFVRHVGPYMECGKAWEALYGWAGPQGLLSSAAPMIGVSHDDPKVTPPEKLRYDACIPVGDEVEADGPVSVQTLEGGAYAVTTHKGPYSKLAEIYCALYGQWLPTSGYTCRDLPAIEIYHNCPGQTPEEDLLTEIRIPVSKA